LVNIGDNTRANHTLSEVFGLHEYHHGIGRAQNSPWGHDRVSQAFLNDVIKVKAPIFSRRSFCFFKSSTPDADEIIDTLPWALARPLRFHIVRDEFPVLSRGFGLSGTLKNPPPIQMLFRKTRNLQKIIPILNSPFSLKSTIVWPALGRSLIRGREDDTKPC